MSSEHLLYMIILVWLLIVAIAVGFDANGQKRNDKRSSYVMNHEVSSSDIEQANETYGPSYDQMDLNEFLDFWILLTEDQKDFYVKQSWSENNYVSGGTE